MYAEEVNNTETKIEDTNIGIQNDHQEDENSNLYVFDNFEKTDNSEDDKLFTSYTNSDSNSSNGLTLKVEWNQPVLGQSTTFHVSATGGSGKYLFRMDAPGYCNPGEWTFESVADPSRGEWTKYTTEETSHDYEFTMTASGTYNFKFYLMDKNSGVYYLRTSTNIEVSDSNYPSINGIVISAVEQCNQDTKGSDYEKALWLHDWLLNQIEYDNSLKWSSAESALTRGLGTCQAYESAYSQLLTTAGIENAEIRDTYDGHTWNAVKLDGEWYQVDCTWDDSNDNWYNFDQKHLYFGLTDELMAIAHPGHSKIYTTSDYCTRSTNSNDNYFVRSNDAYSWAENYKERIQEKLNNRETEFTINADNASYPHSILAIQNGIVAYAINQMEWCTENCKANITCVSNGIRFEFNVKYFPAVEHKEHEWDSGRITQEATCESTGIEIYTCIICGETKMEKIPSIGHNWDNGEVVRKPTVKETGILRYTCTNCKSTKDVILDKLVNGESDLDKLARDNKDVLKDGVYYIETSLNSSYVIGVNADSTNNLANVELQSNKGSSSQQWKVTHDEKGYVSFENLKSGKMFDLDRGGVYNYSNVQQYESNGLYPQKWIVLKDEEGMRIIPSASKEYSLDLSMGNASRGSNIQLYSDLNNQPQRWNFRKAIK